MKKTIIALVVLIIVVLLTYFMIFNKQSSPAYQANQTASTSSFSQVEAPNNVSKTPESASVIIKNYSFNPPSLTIKIGTKVTWTNNNGGITHTVTSDTDGLLNSPQLADGQSFSYTFTKVGITNYHCNIHPMMKGQIVVE